MEKRMVIEMAEADTKQITNSKTLLKASWYLDELVQAHSDELVMLRMAESIVTETDRITGIIQSLLLPTGTWSSRDRNAEDYVKLLLHTVYSNYEGLSLQ